MHSKKTRFGHKFSSYFKRIFRARNIIVVSEHKVDHIPLSGVMQLLLVFGTVGLFSGVSYLVGSYMTASNVIHEKEQKIATATIEKTRIGEEMNVLKHDLLKLSKNGEELSDYTKFIMNQYTHNPVRNDTGIQSLVLGEQAVYAQNNSKLLERISFLEKRVQDITKENQNLVTAIRLRTDKKLDYFEDVIAMTGLNPEKLEQLAETERKAAQQASAKSRTSVRSVATVPDAASEKTADSIDPNGDDARGGPFIAEQSFTDEQRELLKNVDRLVLLHSVVERLPLRMPIKDAQAMSPFGRRVDPFNRRWAMHPGLDLAGPSDSKIFSTNDGVVVAAERRAAYGNMVDVAHGFGIVTRYAHLSKISVQEGQKVKKGQLLGIQGSTGRSTGPHLHYEVRVNDHPVNPAKFLQAGEYVLED